MHLKGVVLSQVYVCDQDLIHGARQGRVLLHRDRGRQGQIGNHRRRVYSCNIDIIHYFIIISIDTPVYEYNVNRDNKNDKLD